MKKSIVIYIALGLVVGCGDNDKKEDRPQTPYEKRLAHLEAKIAEWEESKAKGLEIYSIGYNRLGSPNYYVDIDVGNDEFLCRSKTPLGEAMITEKGDKINSNDWEGTLAYTIEQVHAECRKSIKKNPEAILNYSWGSTLVWCQGNFGIDDPRRGIVHFGIPDAPCEGRSPD